MRAESPLLRNALAIAGILLILSVLTFLFLIVRIGTIEAAGRPPVIVAAIGLVGIVFTGSITVVGLLLKDSLDRRVQAIATDAEARLLASTTEAELRLKADTSLKAIELMTARDLEPAIMEERREGAIIALSSLGYHKLNLQLCERYWKHGNLSPGLLMAVLDECLRSEDSQLQARAGQLLVQHADKLPRAPGYFDFPRSYYLNWRAGLGVATKRCLLHALAKGMLSKPFSYWSEHIPNQFAYALFKMLKSDDDRAFRMSAALIAIRVCRLVSETRGGVHFIPPDRPSISFTEIRAAALEALNLYQTEADPDEQTLRQALHDAAAEVDYELSLEIMRWKDSSDPPKKGRSDEVPRRSRSSARSKNRVT